MKKKMYRYISYSHSGGRDTVYGHVETRVTGDGPHTASWADIARRHCGHEGVTIYYVSPLYAESISKEITPAVPSTQRRVMVTMAGAPGQPMFTVGLAEYTNFADLFHHISNSGILASVVITVSPPYIVPGRSPVDLEPEPEPEQEPEQQVRVGTTADDALPALDTPDTPPASIPAPTLDTEDTVPTPTIEDVSDPTPDAKPKAEMGKADILKMIIRSKKKKRSRKQKGKVKASDL